MAGFGELSCGEDDVACEAATCADMLYDCIGCCAYCAGIDSGAGCSGGG